MVANSRRKVVTVSDSRNPINGVMARQLLKYGLNNYGTNSN